MQALNDDPRIESLEKKIDKGFAEIRTEIKGAERELRSEIITARTDARSDFRTLVALSFAMWVTTILCVVGVLLQHQL